MNKSKSFDPIWVPIISQYQNTKNLELDEKLIQKHINWLDPHVKQFLVCGTTGDGWNLTDKLIFNWLDILNDNSLIKKDNKILLSFNTPDSNRSNRRKAPHLWIYAKNYLNFSELKIMSQCAAWKLSPRSSSIRTTPNRPTRYLTRCWNGARSPV